MMAKNALIHIGYHKSGTSFLQDKVFQKFGDYFSLVHRKLIGQKFIEPTPFHFDIEEAKSFCEKEINNTTSTYSVFSNERLSGSPHAGDFNTKYIADRLVECLPHAKVIIIIREQKDMIKSSYFQYLKARGSCDIKEYMMPKNASFFRLNSLKYHLLIHYYYQLFGENNVLVLPYEMLKSTPEKFLEYFFQFLGLNANDFLQDIDISQKVNEALKPVQLQLKRYFNPFIMEHFLKAGSTFNNKLAKISFSTMNRILAKVPTKKMDTTIDNKIEKLIHEYTKNRYEASNHKTSELIGVNLKDYGYAV